MLNRIIIIGLLLIPLGYFCLLSSSPPSINQISLSTAITLEDEPLEPQHFSTLSGKDQNRIQTFIANAPLEGSNKNPLTQQEIINLIALSLLPVVYFLGSKYVFKTTVKGRKP